MRDLVVGCVLNCPALCRLASFEATSLFGVDIDARTPSVCKAVRERFERSDCTLDKPRAQVEQL